MKTKIAITNIIDLVLGIVMFSLALAELFAFGITSDTDKLIISLLCLTLGMRYTCDSIDKFYFKVKEENSYKCCANCSYAEFTGIGCSGKIEVICTKNKVLPIIEEPGRHKYKLILRRNIIMDNEKMNNTEVEAEANTNEEVKDETPVNEIKAGHMSLSTIGVWGFYGAALGVRRSFRSTEKCDSNIETTSYVPKEGGVTRFCTEEELGEEDLKLMKKLILRGTDEAKFARAIHVQVNIKAPLSWWKQFDTYKVGTVRLSDSTMHNILKDRITTESFAASSIIDHPMKLALAGAATSRTIFMITIQTLEMLRINWWRMKNTIIDKEYLETYGQEAFDEAVKKRKEGMDTCWRQIIDMLPDSYLMESTIDLNYQVLRNICSAREGHKLGKDGWETFIEWAKTLPYAEELIFGGYKYLAEASEPIKAHEPEYISSVIKPLNITDEGENEASSEENKNE